MKNTPNIIFSTDPDYKSEISSEIVKSSKQDFRIHLNRRPGGKIVTIVKGFIGNQNQIKTIGKKLKKKCGVGGTVKNNEILIQGNFRDKVIELLKKQGHIAKPSGG